VAKSNSKSLRVFRGRRPQGSRPDADKVRSLPAVLAAFCEATGWSLQYRRNPQPSGRTNLAWSTPVDLGDPAVAGQFSLRPPRSAATASGSRKPPAPVEHLAASLAALVKELLRTRHALWQREAELAADVPVVFRRDGPKHLAARLQAVLRGGAQAVGCHAAALYLLDEGTTSLKLRSSWGLPPERLTEPPRPLRGALADLEALLGHVVVLEDTGLFQQWNPPENFPSAACAPLATATTILGTLWVFCHSRRDFNDRETNILEVVAGRLAADLEKEVLARESFLTAPLKRQLAAAHRRHQSLLPSQPPLVDGWDCAGCVWPPDTVAGAFFDWFPLPHGETAFVVGQADGDGIEAALTATAVRAAVRAHAQHDRDPASILRQVNSTLWTGSPGDQSASLLLGLAQPRAGQLTYASAGDLPIAVLRSGGGHLLTKETPLLGRSEDPAYVQSNCPLGPSEAIVVATAAGAGAIDGGPSPLAEGHLADLLPGSPSPSAKELVALVCQRLESRDAGRAAAPGAVLAVRRTKT